MSDGPSTVRTNISLPRALKEQMDAADSSVNWSAVAKEAFERKLLELKTQAKKGDDMDSVIERLRAKQQLEDSEAYAEGKEAGEQWVKGDDGSPRQMRRLASHQPYNGRWADEIEVWNNPQNSGIASCLAEVIEPSTKEDGHDDFWETILGEKWEDSIADVQFALGFVEGALEMWGKVKGKL